MRIVSKAEYINCVTDYEKCYIIYTDNSVPYLRADIEYGGEIGLRIELMNFKMIPDGSDLDISTGFSELTADCRGYYAGGISFIEYDTYEEAKENVLNDFLEIRHYGYLNDIIPVYLICKENEMNEIVSIYPNAELFLLIS